MNSLESQLVAYFDAVLGIVLGLDRWDGARSLPALIRSRYRFAQTTLAGRQLLLMLDESKHQEHPSIIGKHRSVVGQRTGDSVAYVRAHVSSPVRARLIEQHIPFIIPGNQMFMPGLGFDLRERFRPAPDDRTLFRPATQRILFWLLLGHVTLPISASALLPRVGYTAMTISRAFNELEQAGLVESSKVGRERQVRLLCAPSETWEQSQSMLINPIRRRMYIRGDESLVANYCVAGESALARMSMLAAPSHAAYAMTSAQWSQFSKSHAEAVLPLADPGAIEVEVWCYAPFSHDIPGVVEPLSLAMSLQDRCDDERVHQAVETVVGNVRWSLA